MASRKYLQYKEKNERSAFDQGPRLGFKNQGENADKVPPPGQSLLAADSVPEVPPTLPTPCVAAKPSVNTKAPSATVVSATASTQAASVPVVALSPRMSAVEDAENVLAIQDLTLSDDRFGQQKRGLSVSPQKSPMGKQAYTAVSPLLPPAPIGYWVYSAERMLVRSGPWALTSMRPQDEGQAGNWYFLEPMDKVAGVKEY